MSWKQELRSGPPTSGGLVKRCRPRSRNASGAKKLCGKEPIFSILRTIQSSCATSTTSSPFGIVPPKNCTDGQGRRRSGRFLTNANACVRWLARQSPDLDEARAAVERIVRDGGRASEVIERIRALVKKSPPRQDWLNINDTILEVIALARSEMHTNRISLQTQLADRLPLVRADRVQFQQVVLNLIINGIEAMNRSSEGRRELRVSTERDGSNGVLIAVRDSGVGLNPENLEHLFDPFYTTKPDGMGMGLAISRSIIEAHGGRLWAALNAPCGAVFQFTLPHDGERAT